MRVPHPLSPTNGERGGTKGRGAKGWERGKCRTTHAHNQNKKKAGNFEKNLLSPPYLLIGYVCCGISLHPANRLKQPGERTPPHSTHLPVQPTYLPIQVIREKEKDKNQK